MEFAQLIENARAVRKEYAIIEKRRHGREWSGEELMLGYMKDIGDLAKLVQAKGGVRDTDDVDQKLAHELSDCLWSVIVLADYYGVDLEASFIETMNQLRVKIREQK
jgi:NTP pyrophosphatase (non-canonical NTP hydrolase)